MSYPLYYTLNKNLKKTEMKPSEKKKLKEKIENLDDDSKKAIILLLVEHARATEDFTVNIEKIRLPFGLKQKGKDVEINFEKLPNDLKHILFKFLKI